MLLKIKQLSLPKKYKMKNLFIILTLLFLSSCTNGTHKPNATQEFKNDTINWCELECTRIQMDDTYGFYGIVSNNDSTYVVNFKFSHLRPNTYVYNAEYVIGGEEFLKLLEKYSPVMKKYDRLLREANINNHYESFPNGCRYLRIDGRAAFFFGTSSPVMADDFDTAISKLKGVLKN